MVKPLVGKAEAGVDILKFEIGQFLHDLFRPQAVREELQDVTHANTHAPNAGTSAALFRIYRDTISELGHREILL